MAFAGSAWGFFQHWALLYALEVDVALSVMGWLDHLASAITLRAFNLCHGSPPATL